MQSERTVLVTGSSSGIGLALSREFAAQGHRCIPTARSAEAVGALLAEGFDALPLDVTDPESIAACVEQAIARAGRIDILVNNAGVSLFGPLAETPIADVRHMLETNFIGPLAVVQAVFPHMARQGSGRIVNVGSMVGVVPTPWVGAYSGAKAGLHMLSETLRTEVQPFGIDVVVVQPGGVRSEVAAKARRHSHTPHYAPAEHDIERRADASQSRPMSAEDFARRVVRAVTRPRAPRVVRAGAGLVVLGILERAPRLRDWMWSRAFGVSKLPGR
jgi:NAD(P)-dependent dehydrogenase (short-subunit alcohol dehydrogenase family)